MATCLLGLESSRGEQACRGDQRLTIRPRGVGIRLRYVGNGLTFACELAAFDFFDLLVFVGFEFLVGGRGRNRVG